MRKYGKVIFYLKELNNFRRIVAFFVALVIFATNACVSYAHDRDEHDQDIEYVLFGDKTYKSTHPAFKNKIQAIEDATYLCVDQFNGNGKNELANLQKEKIPNIPKSIDEFDFTANFAHRNFTHRGWNVNYDKKANWPVRQQILINTVDKELFSEVKPVLSNVPWLSEKLYGDSSYKKKCESLCILLYYTHIIGDHIEADNYKALAYVDPLTNLNDRDNPGIIPDLIKCCDTLFEDQANSYSYKEFKQELEDLRDKSDKLTSSKGGVDTEEEFEKYHKCAEDLLELLATYVPKLLTKEDFFSKSFK